MSLTLPPLLVFLFIVCIQGPQEFPPPPPLGFALAADQNRDGKVSLDEWNLFLGSLVFDENGHLDLNSFHQALHKARPKPKSGKTSPPNPPGEPPSHTDQLPAHPLDLDRDGTISLADFDAIFTHLDQNKNGTLENRELPRPPRPPQPPQEP